MLSAITNGIHFWTDGLPAQNFRNTMLVHWTCLLANNDGCGQCTTYDKASKSFIQFNPFWFIYILFRQYKSFTSHWYWIINVDGNSLLLSAKHFNSFGGWSSYWPQWRVELWNTIWKIYRHVNTINKNTLKSWPEAFNKKKKSLTFFCFSRHIFSEIGNSHNKNNQVTGDFKVICYPKTSLPRFNLKAKKRKTDAT